ncbi:MAG: SPOR domain-containing protein [bacterium]
MRLSISSNNCTANGRKSPTAVRLLSILLLTFIAAALWCSGATATTSQVYDFIANDQVDQARQLLATLIRTEYANAERLYLSGVLTADADSALDYYARALELAESEDIVAASLIGIANYCLLRGNNSYGLEFIDRYRGRCDHSAHCAELMRLRALLRFGGEDQWKSRGELKDAWEECRDLKEAGTLALALGDIYLRQDKTEEAVEYFRALATGPEQRYFGAASLRLIDAYLASGDFDNAQFTYNVVKSRQPLTLGLQDLSSRFGDSGKAAISDVVEADPSSGSKSSYAIRVGTYSGLADAEAQQRRFAVQGYSAKMGRVRISGNNYYVVDVGEYSSKLEATQVMEKLAEANRDTYHLVTF